MSEEFQNLYLDYAFRNQNHLLLGDGPLPFAVRHYIALMAAVVHSHFGLTKYNADKFLYRGGSPPWLNSLDSVPPKLQNLREINEILATEPWLLSSSHISVWYLAESTLSNPPDWHLGEGLPWMSSELLTFAYCNSRYHTVEEVGSAVYDFLKLEDACSFPSPEGTTGDSGSSSPNSEPNSAMHVDSVDCDINCAVFFSCCKEGGGDGGKNPLMPTNIEVLGYLEDMSMTYHEFRERQTGRKASGFHFHDYSWQDHGYSLLNRLYMEYGVLLDEEFSVIQNESAALYEPDRSGDAVAYTWAVWNYVFQLFGVQLEDYHRREIDQRLSLESKGFIKLVSCFPERLHLPLFSRFTKSMKTAEKRHINVLVQEALFQVLLLYSLRALCKSV